MNNSAEGDLPEPSLLKMYMDLTGASEAEARSVLMYVGGESGEGQDSSNGPAAAARGPEPVGQPSRAEGRPATQPWLSDKATSPAPA